MNAQNNKQALLDRGIQFFFRNFDVDELPDLPPGAL
jgi:hypothetical protein